MTGVFFFVFQFPSTGTGGWFGLTVTWTVPVAVSAPSLTTYWNESEPMKPVFGVYMQLKTSQETVPCAAAGAALVIVTSSRSGS